jgi:hypothetical protein
MPLRSTTWLRNQTRRAAFSGHVTQWRDWRSGWRRRSVDPTEAHRGTHGREGWRELDRHGLHGVGKWLSCQRAEILIILGLAAFGGACGWFLRDQLMKRSGDTPREISHLQTRLDAHRRLVRDPPAAPLPPSGALDRPASTIDRESDANLRI